MRHQFFERIDCEEARENPEILFDIVDPFFRSFFDSLAGIKYIEPRFPELSGDVSRVNPTPSDEELGVLASKSKDRILEWTSEILGNAINRESVSLRCHQYDPIHLVLWHKDMNGTYGVWPDLCGSTFAVVSIKNYEWLENLLGEDEIRIGIDIQSPDIQSPWMIHTVIESRRLGISDQNVFAYKSMVTRKGLPYA